MDTKISAAFSQNFSDTTKAGVNVLASNNKTDFDQGDSETDLQTVSAFFESSINEKWSQKLSVSRSENDLVSTSSFGSSTFDTEREVLDWQNNLNLSEKTALVVGANYRKDHGNK